jgi:hypothetical protein
MITNIIQLLHLFLVLGVASSVFIPDIQTKKLALTFLLFIFVQYITNYGKCGLTELEYAIKGENYKEGFIYRLVKPIISVPEKYFDEHLYWIHVIWILILGYQLLNYKM